MTGPAIPDPFSMHSFGRNAGPAQDTSSTANKVRENRLRRMAARQGLQLVKSGRRDPRALDYGLYMLTRDGHPFGPDSCRLTLDMVEHILVD